MSTPEFPKMLWVEAVPDEHDPDAVEEYRIYFQQTGYGELGDGRRTTICEYVPLPTLTEGQRKFVGQARRTHELKSHPVFFEPILEGRKTFDLRYAEDRNFREGDCLWLREWDPETQDYTGREHTVLVTYITRAPNHLRENNVCMGIAPVDEAAHKSREQEVLRELARFLTEDVVGKRLFVPDLPPGGQVPPEIAVSVAKQIIVGLIAHKPRGDQKGA